MRDKSKAILLTLISVGIAFSTGTALIALTKYKMQKKKDTVSYVISTTTQYHNLEASCEPLSKKLLICERLIKTPFKLKRDDI